MTSSSPQADQDRSGDTRYLLGHTDDELRRLDIQGDLYRDITRRAFREGGLEPGMRVLDIGCGTGDVSMIAADVVGDSGYVLGIDRGPEGIAVARTKAAALGAANVEFEVGDIADFDREGTFDALVGRFVLMHQSDPSHALRSAARAVRPCGVVVMIESYMELLRTGAHSEPHSPLYDRIVRWKSAVVRGAGADLKAGGRLRGTFTEAGLPAPETRLETPLEGGPGSHYYEYVAHSVRSMLPEAGRLGLEGFGPGDVEGLAEQLRDEVVALGGSLLVWPVVVARARLLPVDGNDRDGTQRSV